MAIDARGFAEVLLSNVEFGVAFVFFFHLEFGFYSVPVGEALFGGGEVLGSINASNVFTGL